MKTQSKPARTVSISLWKARFTFSNWLTIHAQIDYVIGRAASRFFVVYRLADMGVNKTKIKSMYCSIVRSIIEYSSVTYGHSSEEPQPNDTIQTKEEIV